MPMTTATTMPMITTISARTAGASLDHGEVATAEQKYEEGQGVQIVTASHRGLLPSPYACLRPSVACG